LLLLLSSIIVSTDSMPASLSSSALVPPDIAEAVVLLRPSDPTLKRDAALVPANGNAGIASEELPAWPYPSALELLRPCRVPSTSSRLTSGVHRPAFFILRSRKQLNYRTGAFRANS
jgi:hypothetical protein